MLVCPHAWVTDKRTVTQTYKSGFTRKEIKQHYLPTTDKKMPVHRGITKGIEQKKSEPCIMALIEFKTSDQL